MYQLVLVIQGFLETLSCDDSVMLTTATQGSEASSSMGAFMKLVTELRVLMREGGCVRKAGHRARGSHERRWVCS